MIWKTLPYYVVHMAAHITVSEQWLQFSRTADPETWLPTASVAPKLVGYGSRCLFGPAMQTELQRCGGQLRCSRQSLLTAQKTAQGETLHKYTGFPLLRPSVSQIRRGPGMGVPGPLPSPTKGGVGEGFRRPSPLPGSSGSSSELRGRATLATRS